MIASAPSRSRMSPATQEHLWLAGGLGQNLLAARPAMTTAPRRRTSSGGGLAVGPAPITSRYLPGQDAGRAKIHTEASSASSQHR